MPVIFDRYCKFCGRVIGNQQKECCADKEREEFFTNIEEPVKRGVLWKTKCLVIGAMQYGNGRPIRERFKAELEPLGLTIFDHYNKPFVEEVDEGEDTKHLLKKWMASGQYDLVVSKRNIRLVDLKLVDCADIVIFHFDPKVLTCGSWEEFFWAARLKKLIFFINTSGKLCTPYWVLWTIPHKYIFDNEDQVIDLIKKVDKGEEILDNERLKLLKPEFR